MNLEEITVIMSVLTLRVTIIGIVKISSDNKKSRQNEYITNNRVDWMQTLRGLMGKYYEEVYKIFPLEHECFKNQMIHIWKATNMLRIQLNYNGIADSNLLTQVFSLNHFIEIFTVISPVNYNIGEQGPITIDTMQAGELTEIDEYYKIFYESLGNTDSIDNELENLNGRNWKTTPDEIEVSSWHFEHIIRFKMELITIYMETYLKVEWERCKHEIKTRACKSFDMDKKYKEQLKNRKRAIVPMDESIKAFNYRYLDKPIKNPSEKEK